MNKKLNTLINSSNIMIGDHGIYLSQMPKGNTDQDAEKSIRESVAAKKFDDYLEEIALHHSIPVMDDEVDVFLSKMPKDALILDIGGCWGWHWRRLEKVRPDVSVVIIDFVHANLLHAKKILGDLVGRQVVLLHADATSLPFVLDGKLFDGFDGVWTVQVFQHIPDFSLACREAFRVLRPHGVFVNYSLHNTPLNKLAYRIMRKSFQSGDREWKHVYYLKRANNEQHKIVKEIFNSDVTDRYTECLFHPDLRFKLSGKVGSSLGEIDRRLGGIPWIGRWIGRQRSFEVVKAEKL